MLRQDRFFFLPLLVLLPSIALLAPQRAVAQACGFAFEDLHSLGLPPPEPETRLIARDLDRDGRDEILVTYPTCPGSIWIIGTDGATLSVLQVLGPADGLAASPSGIDAADVDLDGDIDLIVGHLEGTGCADRGITVFHRRGDGTYGDALSFPGDNDGRHLLAVDLKGDGVPFIVTGDGPRGSNPTTGKAIQVFENEGPGSFDHVHEYGLQPAAAGSPSLLASGMLDNLSRRDVFIYWDSPNATVGLCNFGDSTFENVGERRVDPQPSGARTGAAAADLNGDGLLDLVLAYGEASSLVVHLAGTIGDARDCALAGLGGAVCQTAEGLAEISLADFDGDGEIDIVGLIGSEQELGFHGSSGGVFSVVQRRAHAGRPARATPAALSGDPRPDLAVLDEDGRLHLLRNETVDERCPWARPQSQPILGADATCNGNLILDGSASSDPEGLPLRYLWYRDGVLVVETDEPVTTLPAPIGTHEFILVVRDAEGNESRPAGLTLRVRDGVPPIIDADIPGTAECTSFRGAVVDVTATASDECTRFSLTRTRSPAGSFFELFPIGVTRVTWRATDEGGNVATETVEVEVVDTSPPILTCPPLVTVDCEGAGMAVVELIGTVRDVCSESCALIVSNDHGGGGVDASGLYALGETLVTFRAEDAFGNASTCETRVLVVDADPLVLELPPSPLRVECVGEEGGFATLVARASDLCSEVTIDNDRSGGSDASGLYPFATTRVGWTARDEGLSFVSGETFVEVVDSMAPTLLCPSLLVAECNGREGASVAVNAQALDRCDPAPLLGNDRTGGGADASGPYPLGSTEVVFEALDSSGNLASCLTRVEVRDTTPPEVACPSEIRLSCSGGGEAFAVLQAEASDCCDEDPQGSNDRTGAGLDASGPYPLGTTRVLFTAIDAAGLVGTCETQVIVEDLEPPTLACAAEVRAECQDPAGTFVGVSALAFDDCDAAPSVSNDRSGGGSDASGLYPLGTTLVRFDASDAAGFAASCETRVIVEDSRAPLLACPSLVEAECLGASGTRVSLQALAVDACDPLIAVANDRTAGGRDATGIYPLGDTRVRFTAVDAAGFSASCESIVRVIDSLPPQVLIDTDDRCLWPPNHRFVRFRLGEELRILSTDLCADEADLELEILEVLSNEDEDGRGDGSTAPDVVVREGELFLRSERSGGAPGRIHAVRVLVSDPSGNSTIGQIEIRVPHGGSAPEGCKSLPPDRFFKDEDVFE